MFDRLRWALRKSRLPVTPGGLVLDVGSGGTPYPRSDVLLDRLTGAEHRCGDMMMIDRPTVFGDAQKMPFRDKVFDFAVASHILEHMAHPELFLQELQRVAKAGYIETPNVLFERLQPYNIHCLEVAEIDGTLHIHKKRREVEDEFLGNLSFLEKQPNWKLLFYQRLELFHVRLFWIDTIDFVIHNNEVSCEWIENINAESEAGDMKSDYLQTELSWRKIGLNLLNKFYGRGRRKRLKNFQLEGILCCPHCKSDIYSEKDRYICGQCNISYPKSPIPDFGLEN